MLVYCTTGNSERFDLLQTAVGIMRGAVDRIVVICNNQGEHDRWQKDQLDALQALGAETYEREWNDNFPDMRNAYLEKCQHAVTDENGNIIGDWIITSDADEHFCDAFVNDIQSLIISLDSQNVEAAQINAHDITYPNDWKQGDPKPEEVISSHFKLLIFKYIRGTRYQGVGNTKDVHEILIPPRSTARLDPKYYYTHIKYGWEVWERATRNVFIGGGGNNVGSMNQEWTKLREICEKLDINTWPEFRHYLQEGNISTRVKHWIHANRFNGFDYQEEMMNIFKYYYYHLHPADQPTGMDVVDVIADDSLPGIYKFIEQAYLEHLGRHADQPGKEQYGKLIHSKAMSKKQFLTELKTSPEGQAKNRDQDTERGVTHSYSTDPTIDVKERLPVQIPIESKVMLNEEIMFDIVKRSTIWNQKMKPQYFLGRKMALYQGINWKVETQGRGDDKAPVENFETYIKQFQGWFSPEDYPRMLEIGAGAGDETFAFAKAGYTVFGITNGEDNLRLAKERYDITLYEIDMHDLPFPKDMFDCATIIHTYEHVYNEMMFLGELYYVLRDGGRVFVAVPDPEHEASKTIWHVNLKTSNQVIDKFAYWGFKCLNHEAQRNPGTESDWNQYTLIFEKLPANHSEFKNWNYLQHLYHKREKLH